MPDISKYLNYGAKQLAFRAEQSQLNIDAFFVEHDNIAEDTLVALANETGTSTLGAAVGSYADAMAAIIREVLDISFSDGMLQYSLKEVDNDPNAEMVWTVRSGNPCPDCSARNGEVKTLSEWELEGFPSDGITLCGGHCHCTLEPVK